MTDFFDEFDAQRWHFTFMDEKDTSVPVQKVGLVAVFHLIDAYLPVRRKGIAEAFALYDQYYGDKLRGGYREDLGMAIRPYSRAEFGACRDNITTVSPMEAVEFKWMSRPSLQQASDYMFGVFSPEGWYEQVHKTLTTVRFYLPIEELRGEGKAHVEQLLLACCDSLRPLHGAAGLGIQECHEWEDFQPTEYEVAWAYRGVDVCTPMSNKSWRDGYSNLNWYTFLAHHWLKKLGAPEELRARLDDDRIAILPYSWGSMIRAGDWPALGKADVDPRPELYVKVNEAIKPLRVADIGSLHYGSIAGEVRFNPRTSNLWLHRFDAPPEIKAVIDGSARATGEPAQFLRVPSGVPCPWPGVWVCEEAPRLGKQTFIYGVPLPEVDGKPVTWRLVKAL